MSTEETGFEGGTAEEKRYSGFWPLAIVAATLVVILTWQIVLVSRQGEVLRSQLDQRKALVDQSQSTQKSLEKLVRDLLTLAKTDDAAKALVDKYKITENKPAQ